MKLAILATAFAALAVPTAFAEPYVVYGHMRSVDVYTGDLDLSDQDDREEAADRISLATDAACGPFPDVRVLQEVHDWRSCRGEAFAGAIAQLEHRTAHPRRGRVTTREYQGEPPPPPEDDDD